MKLDLKFFVLILSLILPTTRAHAQWGDTVVWGVNTPLAQSIMSDLQLIASQSGNPLLQIQTSLQVEASLQAGIDAGIYDGVTNLATVAIETYIPATIDAANLALSAAQAAELAASTAAEATAAEAATSTVSGMALNAIRALGMTGLVAGGVGVIALLIPGNLQDGTVNGTVTVGDPIPVPTGSGYVEEQNFMCYNTPLGGSVVGGDFTNGDGK